MTREDFIRRHRGHTAGVIALGTVEYRKQLAADFLTATSLGGAISNLTDTAEALLGRLYDDLMKPAAPAPANGVAQGRKA